MTLTIDNTIHKLWLSRAEIGYFARELEQAGHHDEAVALAEAGYGVGSALLRLTDLVEEQAGTFEESLGTYLTPVQRLDSRNPGITGPPR